MTTLTIPQLEQLWISNGGAVSMAAEMAAIAENESSGETTAENPSGATGLWQLEYPLYGANFLPSITSRASLLDPNINAQAAVKLSQNNPSTTPGDPVYDNWIEYETPANHYLTWLAQAQADLAATPQATLASWTSPITGAAGAVAGAVGGAAASVAGGAVSDVAGAVASAYGPQILQGGTYIALLGAGVGLVIAGIWKLANPGTTIRQGAANVKSNVAGAASALPLAVA